MEEASEAEEEGEGEGEQRQANKARRMEELGRQREREA